MLQAQFCHFKVEFFVANCPLQNARFRASQAGDVRTVHKADNHILNGVCTLHIRDKRRYVLLART